MSNLNSCNSQPKKPLVKRLFENNYFVGLFVGVFIFCLIAIAYNYKLLDEFENTTLGWRYKYFNNNSKASDKCLILAINNDTTSLYGRWPFSRSVMADLVDALKFYGAKTITFDISFADKNQYDALGDRLFAESVNKFQESGNSLILGTMGIKIKTKDFKSYYNKSELEKLNKLSINTSGKINAIKLEDISSSAEKLNLLDENLVSVLQKPYAGMFRVVNNIGSFNTGLKEKSTNVLTIPLVFEFKNMYFPALSLSTYLAIKGNPKVIQGVNTLDIGKLNIPIINNNEYIINFYNPIQNSDQIYPSVTVQKIVNSYRFLKKASKETNIPMEEIQSKIEALFLCSEKGNCSEDLINFSNRFPADAPATFRNLYQGKYVFVGLVDQSGGTKDLINTPVSKDIPGVYLHANILDNFLQNDFIYKVPRKLVLPIILLLTIVTSIVTLGIKNSGYSISFGLLCLCFFVIPLILFNYFHIYTDLFYTQSSIILTLGLSVIYKTWIIDKDKRLLKKQFSNYLSPQILNEILSDPSNLEMGGKRKEISILFSDIRGFTSISEKSQPEEVVSFLNEYFDAMVEEVLKVDGTIDKFIGDAVMAFWGAPLENKKHAELAIKSALGMMSALEEQKKKWVKEGKDYPEISIGIGINTGEALVGNVGSTKIKGYTIIGDAVNLASRLESLNKNYSNETNEEKSIIISEFTYQQVKDIFEVKYLDEVKVKGKDIGVKIYKVIGIKGDIL